MILSLFDHLTRREVSERWQRLRDISRENCADMRDETLAIYRRQAMAYAEEFVQR